MMMGDLNRIINYLRTKGKILSKVLSGKKFAQFHGGTHFMLYKYKFKLQITCAFYIIKL